MACCNNGFGRNSSCGRGSSSRNFSCGGESTGFSGISSLESLSRAASNSGWPVYISIPTFLLGSDEDEDDCGCGCDCGCNNGCDCDSGCNCGCNNGCNCGCC